MTAPLIAVESLAEFEYTVPCAIAGCKECASWMIYGDHSVFGCPGHGPVCEAHRVETMTFASLPRPRKLGRCTSCGEPRIEGPEEYRTIAL
ncbi:hypothetical protein [Mycobacterium phage WXIN]|nr:hypothetical protein [Mycobacterium phage WXIN]